MEFKGEILAISLPRKIGNDGSFIRLIEILGEDKTICLSCSTDQYDRWINVMKVGTTICVSPIIETDIRSMITNRRISVFQLKEPSRCEEISEMLSLNQQEPSSLIDCSGKVTSLDEQLAEFALDNQLTVNLCHINSVNKHTVPWPSVGQKVKITNAHSVCGGLSLCGRSQIAFPDAAPTVLNTKNMPLVPLIKQIGMSYSEIYWLKSQLRRMEEKTLNERFLLSVGIPRPEHSNCRMIMLKCIIARSTPEKYWRGSNCSKVFEFIDHSSCTLSERDIFRCDLTDLKDLASKNKIQDEKSFWNYGVSRTLTVTEFPKTLFIGYLDIVDGHWIFQDGTLTVPCVILNLGDPQNIYRNMVAVSRFIMIYEIFKFDDGSTKHLTYIQFSRMHCEVIYQIPRGNRNDTNICNHPQCEGIGLPIHLCMSATERGDQHNLEEGESSVPNKRRRLEAAKTSCDFEFKVTILQKLSFILKPINSVRFYHILVTVSRLNYEQSNTVSCIFVFREDLVSLVPLLTTGKSYAVHTSVNLLDNIRGDLMPRDVLPLYRESITVPQDAVFILMDETPETTFNFYSVRDSSKIQREEIAGLEGILYDRFSIKPRYNSEQKNYGVDGYGIPGQMNLVLKIKDRPPYPQGHPPKDVCIYFRNNVAHRYPLGMIPGARLRISHVQKLTSGDGTSYFNSTYFTAIEVLEWEEYYHPDITRQFGLTSYIMTEFERESEVNLNGCVDVSHLLNVSLKLVCRNCDGNIDRNTCCRNETVVKASAKFIYQTATQSVTFLVENEMVVKLLQLSEEQWGKLKLTVEKVKELNYNIQKQEDLCTSRLRLSDVVFRNICLSVPKRPVNIVCRLFKNGNREWVYYVTFIKERK